MRRVDDIRKTKKSKLYVVLEWTTSLDSSSGTLICPSLCPRHVGRNNYVPLFGVTNRMATYTLLRNT